MTTVYQLINQHKYSTPDKTAIYYQGQAVTYQALLDDVDAFANGLAAIGVERGSKIALFCGNNIEFATALLAAAKLGAALAPLPLTLKGQALATALSQIDCQFVIAWQHISQILLSRQLISPNNLVTIGVKTATEYGFNELLAVPEQSLFDYQAVTANDDFIYTLTSGSTGQPKPIVFSQQTKINRAFKATIEHYQLTPKDVVLVATPMYHSLAQRSILMPLMLGATAVVLPKFSVAAWLAAVEQQKITFLFAVSSQLTALLPELDKVKLNTLRVLVSSSATLPAEDKGQLLSKLDCQFHECYGASELGVVTDFDITQPNQVVTSVGKPLPFVDIKIVNNNRQALPYGQVGEIACRSATLFKGYYKLPEKTQASMDTQGYFYTGDLGFIDAQGFLHFVGRSNEVIKSGGINVYPRDIELVMSQCQGIEECAALGMPDRQFGEVIYLIYTTASGQPIAEMSLIKHAISELTDYQLPRKYVYLAQLPKSSLGKILKPEIKKQLQAM